MWKLVPEVDAIVPLTRNSLLGAVLSIRRKPSFDVAILFPNSLRVALESWLSGAARRVGFRGHSRKWLLNQIIREPIRRGPPEHQAVHYLRVAQEIGAETRQE